MSHSECAPGSLPASEQSAFTSLSNLSAMETALPEHAADKEIATTPRVSYSNNGVPLNRKATSVLTNGTSDPRFEVDFEEGDPENPRNWPVWYKGIVLFAMSWTTWSVVVYSTGYTSGLPQIVSEFHTSEPIATLGVTTYLLGLAIGSLFQAPISEIYGRRPVYIVSMLMFVLLVIPCGLATTLPEVLVVRFFGAVAGSSMVSIAPGTIGEIVSSEYRALAFSIWSIGPLNGPTFGPIIGGFTAQYLGWRWTNWIVMILSGLGFVFVTILKETYAPVILTRRAELKRKQTNDSRYWSHYDQQRVSLTQRLRTALSRPFIMAVHEPICIFWNIYVAIIYGILYLEFVAYPIVFTDVRGWSIGISGLAFVGIGIGSFLTLGSEPLARRLILAHKKDPDTGETVPEAQVSIVIIGAVLIPMGQLWFSWTCLPPVHWIWSLLAGIPLGAGNTAAFIYATAYLSGSYGIFAASALASNTVIRSILGGTLPLAGPAMYASLGAHWAGTLLGLLQVTIIPIPVVFYLYGGRIRKRSALISRMQTDQARLEGKRSRMAERKISDEEKGMVRRGDEKGAKVDLEVEQERRKGLEAGVDVAVHTHHGEDRSRTTIEDGGKVLEAGSL